LCYSKLFNYTDFSQHNNKLNNNYIYSLQLHVSTINIIVVNLFVVLTEIYVIK